ncbi:hypothetical protein [Arthrobacter sp. UYCo732]|uniref:hypothetical protein n=1 Tax=Arthrobacter sp. UYCo732 TaxID=3156336 RepID=UPI003395433C
MSHRESEVAIGAGFDARYWGLPAGRPGAWVFGDDSTAEIVTGSVVDGPLSQGVARRESLDSFTRWQGFAAGQDTADGPEFAAGLEDGLRALYGSTAGEPTAELLDIAATTPTRPTSRVNWMLGLRSAPSEAHRRGSMAAGVILSGSDEWWGIADNKDLAISGPPVRTPRRGAWSSLASR